MLRLLTSLSFALAAVNGEELGAGIDCNGACPNCQLPSDGTTPACGESDITNSECKSINKYKAFIKQLPTVGTCPGNTDFSKFVEEAQVDYTVFKLQTKFFVKPSETPIL